jgi:TPR repeat protein
VQAAEPETISEKRDTVSVSILNAARAVAERESVKGLTLAKVAAEAELARSVVVKRFARKKDLLLWVAADSVASLARGLVGINWISAGQTSEDARDGAVILTLPRRDLSADGPDSPTSAAPEIPVSAPTPSKSAASRKSSSRGRSKRRSANPRTAQVQVHAIDNAEAAGEKNGEVMDGDSQGAPRAPYSWLERRLRVFERAMALMEVRQERAETDSRSAVDTAEDSSRSLQDKLNRLSASADASIKALQKTIAELVDRVEASEARQAAATNVVRAAVNEANLRIETVEGVARAALVENATPESEEAPVPPPLVWEQTAAAIPADVKPAADETESNKPAPFLAAARASAIAAARTKIAGEATKKISIPERSPTRDIVAAVTFLAVFVAAGVAFSRGMQDERPQSLRHVALQPPAVMVAAAADTALDQLAQNAEAGNADAELAVALKYLNGTNGSRDPAAGMRWMTRAATHGNAVAQYMLGSAYEKGGATVRDPAEAMRWYEASALQGNRKAMHNLAIAYAMGFAGVKSSSEAVRWFSRAASFGYVDSQFDLAVLYERGDGVPQSLLDAYKWYAIAGAQGDMESKSRIEALRTQLSSDDLAAAQHAADAFRALPYDTGANQLPRI